MAEYRNAFREAGLRVASQSTIPDREVEIPSAEKFPMSVDLGSMDRSNGQDS
jgi:hypothetical protein